MSQLTVPAAPAAASIMRGSRFSAGTPAPVVQRLNQEINKTLKDPAVAALADKLGVTLVGGTPQQLGDLQKADSAKWAKVIKDGNIKAD